MDKDQNAQTHDLSGRRSEFGSKLRQVRLASGSSLEGIAQQTKISIQFLSALESGDFKSLPGQVFGRGFVRSIAKLLKTDSSDLVKLYDECWFEDFRKAQSIVPHKAISSVAEQSEEAVIEQKPPQDKHFASKSSYAPKIRFNYIIAGVFLVFLSAFVVKVVFSRRTVPSHSVEKTTHVAAPMPAPVVEAPVVQKNVTTDMAATSEVAPPMVETETVVAKEEVSTQAPAFEQVLEFQVKNTVTLKISIDGEPQKVMQLKPDAYRFPFQNQADLLISDASSVDLSFNGKSLGSLGTKGRMRRISFKAKSDDLSTLP